VVVLVSKDISLSVLQVFELCRLAENADVWFANVMWCFPGKGSTNEHEISVNDTNSDGRVYRKLFFMLSFKNHKR